MILDFKMPPPPPSDYFTCSHVLSIKCVYNVAKASGVNNASKGRKTTCVYFPPHTIPGRIIVYTKYVRNLETKCRISGSFIGLTY